MYVTPFTFCFPHETITFLCPFKIHFNIAKGGRQHFVGTGWGMGTPVGGLDTHTHTLSHLSFTATLGGACDYSCFLQGRRESRNDAWNQTAHLDTLGIILYHVKLPRPMSTLNIC